jgi:hypothetical protein
MSSRPGLSAVLNQLVAENRLAAGWESRLPTLLDGSAASAWYVRLLIALSAWLAALFLLAFLFGAEIVDSDAGAVVIGVLMLGGAIVLCWRASGDFAQQFALALNLAGQPLIVMGAVDRVASGAALVLGLQGLLFAVYRDGLYRFLSIPVAVAALWVLLQEWNLANGVPLLAGALAAAALYLHFAEAGLTAGRWAEWQRPLSLGLIVALFGLLLPWIFFQDVRIDETLPWRFAYPGLTALVLAVCLLYFESRLFADHAIDRRGRAAQVTYAVTLALLIPAQRMPGLLAAVLVLLLGFRRDDRLLMGLAVLFMTIFLSAWYYHLSMTLLAKSGMLVASGAILLGSYWVLSRLLPVANGENGGDAS